MLQKTSRRVLPKVGIALLALFCLAYFKGCTTDIRKNFPTDFWPPIKGVGANSCVDLSGKYKVVTYPENEITEYLGKYIVSFPPGVTTQDNYEIAVHQSGCEQIEIAYTNRFDQKCNYVVNKQQNNLQWYPEQGLFCYKVTAFEPDGFAGTKIFDEDQACMGLGVDGSFLTDFQMHSASRLMFIRGELIGNQKYKFDRVNSSGSK